jgi:hypothetical protein
VPDWLTVAGAGRFINRAGNYLKRDVSEGTAFLEVLTRVPDKRLILIVKLSEA